MASFNEDYFDRISFGPVALPATAVYNGLKGAGDATLANVASPDWWLGVVSGGTDVPQLTEAEIPEGGLFVDCICTDGISKVFLIRAQNLGKTSGTLLTAPFASVSDDDVTANKLVVVSGDTANTGAESTN